MYQGNQTLVLLRGGGDLASGVALRLHRAGLKVVITELDRPLTVRRAVSFAETVYEGRHTVEGVAARLVKPEQLSAALEAAEIPVLIDPDATILTNPQFTNPQFTNSQPTNYQFPVVIDARLLKLPPAPLPADIPLHIGLGPGFHAGVNCHAVIETRRSHTLGRVYWSGLPQPDSGQPEGEPRRVLRAPSDGILMGLKRIGEHCDTGELVAEVTTIENRKSQIVSPLSGVLRGLIHDGLHVAKGVKIGDVDPRDDPSACFLVSDKALAIGGAVLEAILTREEIREQIFHHEGLH
jgi:xanthine dehydrogenase accessory factor